MTHTGIGIIVDRRYLTQEMPDGAIRGLTARGVQTDVICPQGCRFDPATGVLHREGSGEINLNRYDVIVSRNRSALGLTMLAYADAAGIPAINTHASTQRVRNKAKMAVALGHAGVPCAPTVLAADVSNLAGLPDEWFPLILKATYGDNSQGLRLIRRREDLTDVRWSDDLVLAQHYLPNDGFDLKLYVCGRSVFATRKPSPFNGNSDARPQSLQPDAYMKELALRCGEVFGLEIYGVDTIETGVGLSVIEVNEFPNFSGLPLAADCIVDHVLSRLENMGALPNANRLRLAATGT